MLTFDIKAIDETLSSMSPLQRVAFAVACAERLFAIYQLHPKQHPGELVAARAALDQIWNGMQSRKIGQHLAYVDDAEEWLRGEDAKWNPLNPLADNAIASIVFACQCFETGESEPAKWAAVQTYEAADYVAHTLARIDFESLEGADAIQCSACVQTELERQRNLLSVVTRLQNNSPDLVEDLKQRSMTEAYDFARFGEQLLAVSN